MNKVANPQLRTLVNETLAWMSITEKTVEEGECWIWTAATSSGNGYPIMKMPGCPCETVRRIVLRMSGKPLKPRQPVEATCNERLCVNPAHIRASSAAAVAQKAAERGAFSTITRRAKIAASRRGKMKLTLEQAREIRCSEETGPVLAQRYGVNRSLVNNIKAGRAWREYSSPFAGLFSGAVR